MGNGGQAIGLFFLEFLADFLIYCILGKMEWGVVKPKVKTVRPKITKVKTLRMSKMLENFTGKGVRGDGQAKSKILEKI